MFRLSALKLKRTFYVLILAFSFVLVAIPSLSTQFSKASLGVCSDLGYNLDSGTGAPNTDVPAPDATNRKWTVQELFENGAKLSVYMGETGSSTKGSWLLYNTKQDKRGSGYDGWDDQTVQSKLQAARSDGKCMFGGITASIGNMFYALSDWILDLGSSIVGQLYNPTFICAGGTDTNDCMINLVGVIGGSSDSADNGSLISSLYSGIYTPLITFSFLFVAMWLMYKGLIKRELRASFSGILWSLIIFFVGVISMLHPLLLASAPQQANSLIGSCVIGAMNGQNCLDGSTQPPSTITGTDCDSYAGGANKNQTAQLAVNGLGCAIWKAFVLDPWTASEFGRSYSTLYIENAPKGSHVWKIAKQLKNPDDYCVHLKSSQAASSQTNGVTVDGGPQVCNLAIYQLFLNSNVTDSVNNVKPKHDQTVDDRYYNIILPATKDPTMWSAWAPRTLNSAVRIMSSLMSFFSATIAIISLVIFAFWGLIYEFAGTLLMAFAPIFFLVGVVPGNGKRIFLGWLESIVSSILKYLASSLFVIIALTMYAGVVANAHSSGGAFIGILIMVGVMITYRKEIVNLLGQANFGGKRISNAVGEKIKDKAHKAKELGTATLGAGIGAAWGGRNNDRGVAKNFLNGAKSGLGRRLKRENTVLGSSVRQYGITHNQAIREEAELRKRQKAEKDKEEKKQQKDYKKITVTGKPVGKYEPKDPDDKGPNGNGGPKGPNGGSDNKKPPFKNNWKYNNGKGSGKPAEPNGFYGSRVDENSINPLSDDTHDSRAVRSDGSTVDFDRNGNRVERKTENGTRRVFKGDSDKVIYDGPANASQPDTSPTSRRDTSNLDYGPLKEKMSNDKTDGGVLPDLNTVNSSSDSVPDHGTTKEAMNQKMQELADKVKDTNKRIDKANKNNKKPKK